MPKLKSNRGAAKRFRVTGGGAVKRRRTHRNHILSKRTSKNKRQLRSNGENYVNKADLKAIKLILLAN